MERRPGSTATPTTTWSSRSPRGACALQQPPATSAFTPSKRGCPTIERRVPNTRCAATTRASSTSSNLSYFVRRSNGAGETPRPQCNPSGEALLVITEPSLSLCLDLDLRDPVDAHLQQQLAATTTPLGTQGHHEKRRGQHKHRLATADPTFSNGGSIQSRGASRIWFTARMPLAVEVSCDISCDQRSRFAGGMPALPIPRPSHGLISSLIRVRSGLFLRGHVDRR